MLRQPSPEQLQTILERGVKEIVSHDELAQKLKSGRQLRVKLGIDPTSPHLHLGRAVNLWKLRAFQDLGHLAVFIVGDFTGLIGDTSDKDDERPMLTREQVSTNMQTYLEQAYKVLDRAKTEIHYNSEWLSRLGHLEFMGLADLFSLREFADREVVARRLKAGKRVSLREVLYPLLQGYDSVAVKADVELGGTDQRFNLLAGRRIQTHYGQKPQDVLMTELLEGTDGRKMSSSWGNVINLTDEPNEMFGKTMRLKDELIVRYFTLATNRPLETVAAIEKDLAEGANPRDRKLDLAEELVALYHSRAAAEAARTYFVNTFSQKQTPDSVSVFRPDKYDLKSVLETGGLVRSKSEGRRILAQGGVKINGQVIRDPDFTVPQGALLQKGKRQFLKIL